jgi:hypothetical protein
MTVLGVSAAGKKSLTLNVLRITLLGGGVAGLAAWVAAGAASPMRSSNHCAARSLEFLALKSLDSSLALEEARFSFIKIH